MNGRKLFREYAKANGREAVEFVEIRTGFFENDTLVTRDSSGKLEEMSLSYRSMVHWIIANKNIKFNDGQAVNKVTN